MNSNMDSDNAPDNVPEEFVDILVQEFAYDPIRLDVQEDPGQVLYNRRTLERIWDMKHDAVNPYTRQPFDITNVAPQSKLREQMSHYILNNPTLGLEVIPDYTKVLSTRDMKELFNELGFHCQNLLGYILNNRTLCQKLGLQSILGYSTPFSNVNEANKHWKGVWQKLNLVRLYCQYRQENIDTFFLIKGFEYLFKVLDEPLNYIHREYYSSCEYAKEVCKELANIVDINTWEHINVISLPENSVPAFVRILTYLAESKHLKIQSMVLRTYGQLFFDTIFYSFGVRDVLSYDVVYVVLNLLWRRKSRKITNEDVYHGMAILWVAWMKDKRLLLDFEYCVDVLVNVLIICITRLQDLNAVAVDYGESGDIYMMRAALTQVLRCIDFLAASDNLYYYEKERLDNLDIITEVVRIAELIEAGYKCFEPIHLWYAFRITMVPYKHGCPSVISEKHIEIFGKLLESDIEYGEHIQIFLQKVSAAAHTDD